MVVDDSSENKELNKLENVKEVEPLKRRLRSNSTLDPPAKRLRSARSTSIDDDVLKENKPKAVRKPPVPFIKYEGEIKYYTQYNDIAATSDELL